MSKSAARKYEGWCVYTHMQIPWAHLDIAGAAWDFKTKQATGFGASTLAEWAISQGR